MATVFSISPMTVMSERRPSCRQQMLIAATTAHFRFTFPSYPGLADIVQTTVDMPNPELSLNKNNNY